MAKRAEVMQEDGASAGAHNPDEPGATPGPASKPKLVAKPPPDPSQPIECSALLLARPPGVNQTDPAIRVGSYTSNSINIGGLCERIVLHPNGTYVVHVRRSVTKLVSLEEREKFPVQYMVFREGFGEVAQ